MDPADVRLIGFKHHLRAETVQAEAVYLISEHGVTALSGSHIERLAPLLDGTRSFGQIVSGVRDILAPGDVQYAIEQLARAGLVAFTSPATAGGHDADAAAFWSLAGLEESPARLATVRIIDLAGCCASAAAACAESGLQCRDDADISLVLCDDYLDPRLRDINSEHVSRGHPWLLAKPAGAQAWIGPVFTPGKGPCWLCMAGRLENNRDEAHLLQRVLGDRAFPAAPHAALPASRAAAVRLAVLQVTTWLAGIRHGEQDAIHILDAVSLCSRSHQVRRRPQCACCGDPGMISARARKPPILASDRAVPRGGPERVLADYGHLVDPVTGIVAELRRDERCPPFQHAFVSGRNRALRASTLAGIRLAAQQQNGGKGVTETAAKSGALCEAVERYCGTLQGDEAVTSDSLRNLGTSAIHPNECLLFDRLQFADRDRWNATNAQMHRVPDPLDESAVIDWTPVWSVMTGEQRLLPTAMLYYSPMPRRGPTFAMADSNGNAAGDSLEDAVIRGFLELVERDAVALWWYNRTRHPGVSLTSFDDPWIAGLPSEYRRIGREIWAIDLTSDLGIPVAAAVSRRARNQIEDIAFGFGAHPDPRLALRHALTEMGQMLVLTSSGGRGTDNPHLAAWRTNATIANQPHLIPCEQAAPMRSHRGLDLDGIRVIARRAGFDVFILDQTRPDIGMPVVKVIAPGLRHFWPRFAPGRLFDVPVQMGRVARPTEYSDLNPIPIFV